MIRYITKYAVALLALMCITYANTAAAQTSFDQDHDYEFQQALMSSGSYTISENITTPYQLTVAVGKNVTLDLNGKTLTANCDDWALEVAGGASKATLTLSNGTLNIGNGADYNKGLHNEGNLNINATITSSYNVPFITNESGCTVNITGGTYSKSTTGKPLFDNSGTINISGGSFPGTNANFAGGTVNISGGTFGNVNIAGGTVKITGGSFGNVTFGTGNIVITGGTFGTDVSSKVPEGYQCTNVGGTWTVERADVAQIGSTYYESLAAAIGAAGEGDEITLISDVTENIQIPATKKITINLNGHTLAGAAEPYTVDNLGELTLINGTVGVLGNSSAVANSGTLILNINASSVTQEMPLIYNRHYSGVVNITGGNYSCSSTNPDPDFAVPVLWNGGTMIVEDGTFSGEVKNVGDSDLLLKGGTYDTYISDTFFAAGYQKKDNGNGTWTLEQFYVAQVGPTTFYETLAAAIAAAGEGDEILLLSDVTESVIVPAEKKITINLNGYTLTGVENNYPVSNNGQLTLTNGTVKTVTNSPIVQNFGTLTIDVTIVPATNQYDPLVYNDSGVVNITGGNYSCSSSDDAFAVLVNDGTMNISGGTFAANADKRVVYTQGDLNISDGNFTGVINKESAGSVSLTGGTFSTDVTDYCADGYEVKDNGNGTWTVEDASVAQIGTTTYLTLAAAVAAATDGQTIQLLKDTEENVTVPAGKNITIDLDGKTLNGKQTANTCTILNEGTLTLKNGTVKRSAEGSASYYIIENRGTLNMNATVEGSASASLIRNNAATAVMNITDGTYTQTGAFIVLKNDLGTCNVSGGTFSTADDKNVLNNWDTMNITGGTFNGNIFNGAYDTNNNVLSITGGTFNTGKIRTYVGNGKTLAPLKIEGGTFTNTSMVFANTDNAEYTGAADQEKPQVHISGGTFKREVPADLCAENYEPKDNGDGTYSVEETYVAQIGTTNYFTLAAAVAAAQNDETIKLNKDTEENVTVPAGKNITIDLNGKTLNGKQTANTCTILNEGTLTLKNGTVKRSAEGSASYYIIENRGTLNMNATVEGSASSSLIRNNAATAVMNITDGTYTQTGAFIVLKNDLGTCNVSGGTFSTADDKNVLNNWDTMNITGGTFNGNIFNGAYDTNNNVLSITSGTFNTGKIRTYVGNGQTLAPLNIEGGTFTNPSMVFANTDNAEYTGAADQEKPQVHISGGTFKREVPADLCALHYEPKDNGDGTYGVKGEDPVAQIGSATFFTLQEAFSAPLAGDIKLIKDVNLTETVNVSKTVTLNLNGHNITGGAIRAIHVKEGTLTLDGTGKISASGPATNSSVIRVGDNEGTEAGISVGENVTIESDNCYGVTYFGTDNQTVSVAGTIKTVKNAALSGNGTATNGISTVTILPTAVIKTTEEVAIYHPEKDKITIEGGTIEGTSAVEMRSGEIFIKGGTLTATANTFSIKSNGDGSTTAGAALAIAQHTTKNPIKVTIEGGTLIGKKAINEANPENNTPAPEITMSVTGGKFKGEISVADVDKFISGGLFSQKFLASYCKDDYALVSSGDNDYPYGVAKDAVAAIGDVKYLTLQGAINAAEANDTVKMLADVAENIIVLASKSIVLDMNGKTLTEDAENNTQECVISNAGKLTITGNGTMKDAESSKCKNLILTSKELTIENGTFIRDYKNPSTAYYYVVTADGPNAKLTIKNGTFNANFQTQLSRVVLGQNGATVVIEDGKFTVPTGSTLGHIVAHSFNNANVTINGGEFTASATGSMNLYAKRGATLTVNGGKFVSANDNSLIGTEETVTVKLNGGKYNYDADINFSDFIDSMHECVSEIDQETQTTWWVIREIPIPTTLDVYAGNRKIATIVASEEEEIAQKWNEVLTEFPNATSVVAMDFAKWAKQQANIIYADETGNYFCENLSLTDLSNDGYNDMLNAQRTAFYAPVPEFKAANMTYKRTLNDGWNSMALPFSFAPESYNTDTKFYFTKVLVNPVLKDDVVEFSEQSLATPIAAGMPVIVHSTGGEVDFSAEDIMICTTAKSANGMIGTFDQTNEYVGKYAISSTSQSLALLDENSPTAGYLFAFRACINIPSNAKAIRFTFKGEADGINDILFDNTEAGDIFNLSGMKVNKANKPGLYIINGKKVMKK